MSEFTEILKNLVKLSYSMRGVKTREVGVFYSDVKVRQMDFLIRYVLSEILGRPGFTLRDVVI